MNKTKHLSQWQIILIVLGSLCVFGPTAWDALTSVVTELTNIRLEDIFTRAGLFVVGAVMLAIVGLYEIYKESTDRPKSKHIK